MWNTLYCCTSKLWEFLPQNQYCVIVDFMVYPCFWVDFQVWFLVTPIFPHQSLNIQQKVETFSPKKFHFLAPFQIWKCQNFPRIVQCGRKNFGKKFFCCLGKMKFWSRISRKKVCRKSSLTLGKKGNATLSGLPFSHI